MQFLKNILTLLFGYKYYIVIYEMKTSNKHVHARFDIKLSRLQSIDIKYIKKILAKSRCCDSDDILIFNIIRVGKLDGEFDL